jgi:hypothetical protein
MAEANVANTATILGKTTVTRVATHWKTVAYNDPQNTAALKINSLFITNRTPQYNIDVDVRISRAKPPRPGSMIADAEYHWFISTLTLPVGTTLVAISRDNPIWLQPGDAIQILASRNFYVEAVCSYEFISDVLTAPAPVITPPGAVLNLNASQMLNNDGGAQLAWTPPLSDGGAAITNYVVQVRSIVETTSPTEAQPVYRYGYWYSLHKPVSPAPNYAISASMFNPAARNVGVTINSSPPMAQTEKPVEVELQFVNSMRLSTNMELTAAGPYDVPFSTFQSGGNVAFQFRVAALNAAGLGVWSDPSSFVRINMVGSVAVNATALPNRVDLSWSVPATNLGSVPSLNDLTLIGHNIRWSSDNGMTWLPTAAGQRVAGSNRVATVSYLQNGTYYTFSVQPVYLATNQTAQFEIAGPWSAPTRNVLPPGNDFAALQSSLSALFVRWI